MRSSSLAQSMNGIIIILTDVGYIHFMTYHYKVKPQSIRVKQNATVYNSFCLQEAVKKSTYSIKRHGIRTAGEGGVYSRVEFNTKCQNYLQ